METVTHSENETIKLACDLASSLECTTPLFLRGDLGAGKSVFARALIRTLTQNQSLEVPSPTFTLVQQYDGIKFPIFHYDLYRLEDPEEIFELSWDDALAEGLALIEWPQRLGSYAPEKYLDIHISKLEKSPDIRHITITDVKP